MKSKILLTPIRYIHLSLCIVFVYFILQGTSESAYGQWTQHIIESNMKYTCFIVAHDIDKDNDMDLFVADFDAANILLYENNQFNWTKHIIDNNAGWVVGLDLADFDNDGKMDVAAGMESLNLITWYKNTGGYPIQWIKDTIDNAHEGPTEVWVEDIDGDGAQDVVADFNVPGEILWYENNLPVGWISHLIGNDVKGVGGSYTADISNDNKPDVIKPITNQDKIVLFINNLPNSNWTKILLDDYLPGTFFAHTGDLDNDGDIDIAATSQGAQGSEPDIAWYENDGTGENWTKHTVTTDLVRARGLWLVDIDTNEYIDIIANDPGADEVILLKNEDGGQNWTKYVVDNDFANSNLVFAYDIDLDNDVDVIPAIQDGNGPLLWYENPLGSAYATHLEASPSLIQSQSDTLVVTATMYNPDSHGVNAWIVIKGGQLGFVDTIQLYDDGLHSDGNPIDNVWGNIRLTTDLPEDEFVVDLFTYDSTYDDTLGFVTPARFFTLGPVEVERYFPDPDFFCGNTEPTKSGCLNLKLTLKNNSSAASATNITAELVSLDTLISIATGTSDFPEILAGDSSISNNKYRIYISEHCQGDTTIPIEVVISSYEQICWRDTISIFVQEPTINVTDIRTPKVKIFPNPANDQLTIATTQPGQHFIEITSLNGQLLYTEKMVGPTHQLDLSIIQKGVFFITIRTKDLVATRKIIKM